MQAVGAAAFRDDKVSNHWLRDPGGAGFRESEVTLFLQMCTNSLPTLVSEARGPRSDLKPLCNTIALFINRYLITGPLPENMRNVNILCVYATFLYLSLSYIYSDL